MVFCLRFGLIARSSLVGYWCGAFEEAVDFSYSGLQVVLRFERVPPDMQAVGLLFQFDLFDSAHRFVLRFGLIARPDRSANGLTAGLKHLCDTRHCVCER